MKELGFELRFSWPYRSHAFSIVNSFLSTILPLWPQPFQQGRVFKSTQEGAFSGFSKWKYLSCHAFSHEFLLYLVSNQCLQDPGVWLRDPTTKPEARFLSIFNIECWILGKMFTCYFQSWVEVGMGGGVIVQAKPLLVCPILKCREWRERLYTSQTDESPSETWKERRHRCSNRCPNPNLLFILQSALLAEILLWGNWRHQPLCGRARS